MLLLAFDTATDKATSALIENGCVLGERVSRPVTLLSDVDLLLRDAGLAPRSIDALVVGLGPGSFTSTRIGLATARVLGLALGVRAAGVSTLAALAAGTPGALPVIDAKRREIFTIADDGTAVALAPAALDIAPGTRCVGDGALRYRTLLEEAGAIVPSDDAPEHLPWARHHAAIAGTFDDVQLLEPIYVRAPDAVRQA